jgi:hypothetical protein
MFVAFSHSCYAQVGQMEAVGQCYGIMFYGVKNYKIPPTQFSQQVQKVIVKYGNDISKDIGFVVKCRNGSTDEKIAVACVNKLPQIDKDLMYGFTEGMNAASKTISPEHLKGIADLTCIGTSPN